ncbi:hypothetical protein [uncultured Roseibium sp.]|uniref:hypothetical protein n=1 Tax=uncultured Roseibium sp. TaxID=1936171 RepID=UPI0032167C3F
MAWIKPWESVEEAPESEDYRRSWEGELHREVGPKHCLFGCQVKLIGRRYDTDDALFLLEGGRVAEVHLTWSGHQEPDPQWPGTSIFATLEEWQSMSSNADC